MYVWTEYLVQCMLTTITINLSPMSCEFKGKNVRVDRIFGAAYAYCYYY